jgi:hypothetical protein
LDARLPKYIRRRRKRGKMHVTIFQMPTFHRRKILCNKTPSNYIVKIGFLHTPKKVIKFIPHMGYLFVRRILVLNITSQFI